MTRAVAFLFAVLVAAHVVAGGARVVPSCQEDAYIMGVGDFTADGYWTQYVCVYLDTEKD